MADSPSVTFRDHRGVEGAVDDASKPADTPAAPKTPVRRSNGVTTAQALQTERKPAADEGVKAFGAPLGTENDRLKANQSTDANQ